MPPKPVINAGEWSDLIANGHHREGRFYKMDPTAGGYSVFYLTREKMPKNIREKPPETSKQLANRQAYERRKQRMSDA